MSKSQKIERLVIQPNTVGEIEYRVGKNVFGGKETVDEIREIRQPNGITILQIYASSHLYVEYVCPFYAVYYKIGL
jgi:hypothetical protein